MRTSDINSNLKDNKSNNLKLSTENNMNYKYSLLSKREHVNTIIIEYVSSDNRQVYKNSVAELFFDKKLLSQFSPLDAATIGYLLSYYEIMSIKSILN